jgi:hypothetical protein
MVLVGAILVLALAQTRERHDITSGQTLEWFVVARKIRVLHGVPEIGQERTEHSSCNSSLEFPCGDYDASCR